MKGSSTLQYTSSSSSSPSPRWQEGKRKRGRIAQLVCRTRPEFHKKLKSCIVKFIFAKQMCKHCRKENIRTVQTHLFCCTYVRKSFPCEGMEFLPLPPPKNQAVDRAGGPPPHRRHAQASATLGSPNKKLPLLLSCCCPFTISSPLPPPALTCGKWKWTQRERKKESLEVARTEWAVRWFVVWLGTLLFGSAPPPQMQRKRNQIILLSDLGKKKKQRVIPRRKMIGTSLNSILSPRIFI